MGIQNPHTTHLVLPSALHTNPQTAEQASLSNLSGETYSHVCACLPGIYFIPAVLERLPAAPICSGLRIHELWSKRPDVLFVCIMLNQSWIHYSRWFWISPALGPTKLYEVSYARFYVLSMLYLAQNIAGIAILSCKTWQGHVIPRWHQHPSCLKLYT